MNMVSVYVMKLNRGRRYLKEREKIKENETHKETYQNEVIMVCMYKHVCHHETHYFIS